MSLIPFHSFGVTLMIWFEMVDSELGLKMPLLFTSLYTKPFAKAFTWQISDGCGAHGRSPDRW